MPMDRLTGFGPAAHTSRDAARRARRRLGKLAGTAFVLLIGAAAGGVVGVAANIVTGWLSRAWPAADTGRVLELRPNCECCDRDLDPASPDVLICTYECTWCRDCAEHVLHGVCPNCGGELVRRPIRPAHLLAVDPPSSRRVLRPDCAPAPAR
jgi:uncharacterized protein